MDFFINLKAGQWVRQETGGSYFMLADTGAASSVSVRLEMDGGNDEEISQAARGFYARLKSGRFRSVLLRAPVDAVVRMVISDQDIEFNFIDGAKIKAEITNLPLPVSNDRGTPGSPLYVTGSLGGGAPVGSMTNAPPVACGPAGSTVVDPDSGRLELRVSNLGPDPVALGSVGLTWANRCIVLQPGDMWIETTAATLEWAAITDAGKSASLAVQEVWA